MVNAAPAESVILREHAASAPGAPVAGDGASKTLVAFAPFVPPRPDIPAQELGWYRGLVAVRTNALRIWPQAAYEQDILVQRFFNRQRLLLNEPGAIHRVLVENAANYRRSAATIRILRPIVGNGLFLSEGEEWKHQRRTIAPALAPRTLPLLARHVVAVTDEAVARLAAAAGEPVDLLAAMQLLALEIAARSMFSLEMREHGEQMRALIARFADRLARPYFLDMMLPPRIPTLRDLARRRFRRHWIALVDRIIADRLRAPPSVAPRDLFDMLLLARDGESGVAFSREQLRDQVATMVVAGHETTAIALFWSLYLLACVPGEQERVAAEARAVNLTPDSAGAILGDLPRTRAVVNEALRLYPPAFVIVREAIGDDRLGDVMVSPSDLVMIAPFVLHRHARLWRDPHAFDPARFLDGEPPPRFAYLPFGAGPRVCIGAQFALTEATLVLAMLMRRFRVALADRRPVLPAPVITTQPDHPAPFWLHMRG
jgi:cytochrome P450